jgi:hypothetical protein
MKTFLLIPVLFGGFVFSETVSLNKRSGKCKWTPPSSVDGNTFPNGNETISSGINGSNGNGSAVYSHNNTAPSRNSSDTDTGNNGGSGSFGTRPGSPQQQVLDLHNQARRERGTPDLTWSTTLEQQALTWSKQQAADHRMHHSGKPGENIATGNDIVAATRMFIAEKNWDNGNIPDYLYVFNLDECLQHYCHYTQVIWKYTKQVGCASYGGYTTCRYYPPGNKMNSQIY